MLRLVGRLGVCLRERLDLVGIWFAVGAGHAHLEEGQHLGR